MKLTTVAAVAALGLAFVPIIAPQASAQSEAYSDIVAKDHSMRTSKLIGMDIYDDKGAKIGKIEDIMVKGAASEPVAILSVGSYVGGGDKMVEVPISHISLKGHKASMPATKAELASMKPWKFNGLEGGGG